MDAIIDGSVDRTPKRYKSRRLPSAREPSQDTFATDTHAHSARIALPKNVPIMKSFHNRKLISPGMIDTPTGSVGEE